MTKKEKMLVEKWYGTNFDQGLVNECTRAKDICFELNHTKPNGKNRRKELIDELLQTITDNASISIPFDIDYGWDVKLGKNVYVDTNCYFMDGGQIITGDNVFIGPNCGLHTATHLLNFHHRNEGFERAGPTSTDSNTRFGGHVAVLLGVATGEGSAIGVGSVVTKDIPPHSSAVGNLRKVARKTDSEVPPEALNNETLNQLS